MRIWGGVEVPLPTELKLICAYVLVVWWLSVLSEGQPTIHQYKSGRWWVDWRTYGPASTRMRVVVVTLLCGTLITMMFLLK